MTTTPHHKRWGNFLRFHVQVSRPGFWLTHVWFYLLPLGGMDLLQSGRFWFGLIYVTLPLGHLLYGWNDIFDAKTDRLNPRKGSYLFGARGSQEQLRQLPLVLASIQLPFLLVFAWLVGPKACLWTIAIVCANSLYNGVGGGLKQIPVLDLLNQVGYLLVFVFSSWLNQVPQLPWQTFLFGALFAMHSHLFGQIMDLEADRSAGRHTTAVQIGRVASKCGIAIFLFGEALVVSSWFTNTILSGFLTASAVWFLADALVFYRDNSYPTWMMRLFLLFWNMIALLSMVWIWRSATFIRVLPS